MGCGQMSIDGPSLVRLATVLASENRRLKAEIKRLRAELAAQKERVS